MRFLCLHGRGSNSKIFELQTSALRHELGPAHEFEFVEGSIPITPAAGLEGFLSPGDECFAFFEESAEGLRSALQDLEGYVNAEGPFDAIMGFSEGASLAASFIASQKNCSEDGPPFKCAVFICAGGAWDSRGQGKQLQPSDLGDFIHIPAANIMGSKDEHYAQSFNLSQGCDIRTREILDHGGGHEIPRGPRVTVEMAMAINAVIDKALLTQ